MSQLVISGMLDSGLGYKLTGAIRVYRVKYSLVEVAIMGLNHTVQYIRLCIYRS